LDVEWDKLFQTSENGVYAQFLQFREYVHRHYAAENLAFLIAVGAFFLWIFLF
jgi:hypothetical protein